MATKNQLFLIAEYLYKKVEFHEMATRNWVFAIYKSLIVSNQFENKPVYWTKHKQWDIDHNFRSRKAAVKKDGALLVDVSIDRIYNSTVEINASVENCRGVKRFSCNYSRQGFENYLWNVRNPKNATVLLSSYERDVIFGATGQLAGLSSVPINCASKKETGALASYSVEIPAEAENRGEKGQGKFQALMKMLTVLIPLYKNITDPDQLSFIETSVGACVFYLPSSVHKHFSGYISIEALKNYLNGSRMVKDHIYPRKLAARELLTTSMSQEDLILLYNTRLAKFMYLTPSENSLLINYYENHENHDQALEAFQIVKFPDSDASGFLDHKELSAFLKHIMGIANESITLGNLTERLDEFRNLK